MSGDDVSFDVPQEWVFENNPYVSLPKRLLSAKEGFKKKSNRHMSEQSLQQLLDMPIRISGAEMVIEPTIPKESGKKRKGSDTKESQSIVSTDTIPSADISVKATDEPTLETNDVEVLGQQKRDEKKPETCPKKDLESSQASKKKKNNKNKKEDNGSAEKEKLPTIEEVAKEKPEEEKENKNFSAFSDIFGGADVSSILAASLSPKPAVKKAKKVNPSIPETPAAAAESITPLKKTLQASKEEEKKVKSDKTPTEVATKGVKESKVVEKGDKNDAKVVKHSVKEAKEAKKKFVMKKEDWGSDLEEDMEFSDYSDDVIEGDNGDEDVDFFDLGVKGKEEAVQEVTGVKSGKKDGKKDGKKTSMKENTAISASASAATAAKPANKKGLRADVQDFMKMLGLGQHQSSGMSGGEGKGKAQPFDDESDDEEGEFKDEDEEEEEEEEEGFEGASDAEMDVDDDTVGREEVKPKSAKGKESAGKAEVKKEKDVKEKAKKEEEVEKKKKQELAEEKKKQEMAEKKKKQELVEEKKKQEMTEKKKKQELAEEKKKQELAEKKKKQELVEGKKPDMKEKKKVTEEQEENERRKAVEEKKKRSEEYHRQLQMSKQSKVEEAEVKEGGEVKGEVDAKEEAGKDKAIKEPALKKQKTLAAATLPEATKESTTAAPGNAVAATAPTAATNAVVTTATTDTAAASNSSSLLAKMRERLLGSRFRSLNEELYTTCGNEAFEKIQQDPTIFTQYHEGFQSQTKGWPKQPVDVAIQFVRSKPKGTVVADFGCGDARLAAVLGESNNGDRTTPNNPNGSNNSGSNENTRNKNAKNKGGRKEVASYTVHSFDLVSSAPGVVACNMSKVPLPDASVDVAVFSLSLMGRDYGAFLEEATRVLKYRGWLWIAEVRSRFVEEGNTTEDFAQFLKCLGRLGYQLISQDKSNTMFVVFVLRRTNSTVLGREEGEGKGKEKQGLTLGKGKITQNWPVLKACVYKRR